MAAGVHEARTLAIELRAILFQNGECIHIGAQPNHRAITTFNVADHAGFGHFGFGLDMQVGESGIDQSRSLVLGKAQLGMAMDGAPPVADIVVQFVRPL